ncbi:hypothetical protein BZM27_23280 [Paraburkholderia steynii]|uniref:Uncharacterized protein n=1 Tax=Paraburkholderia steynii TaxID=1245441 RepID=A0A4R0XCS7_9BURK|nr:hypothetical protein BZM27_23280 [Paraburkholderia steynii]
MHLIEYFLQDDRPALQHRQLMRKGENRTSTLAVRSRLLCVGEVDGNVVNLIHEHGDFMSLIVVVLAVRSDQPWQALLTRIFA